MTRNRKTDDKRSARPARQARKVRKADAHGTRVSSVEESRVRIARVQAQFVFAKRISTLCERMPLPELAARLGVSLPTLYRWRSALTAPHRPHRWLVQRVEALEQELGL